MCHGTALLLLGQLGPLGQGSHTTVALVWKQREVSMIITTHRDVSCFYSSIFTTIIKELQRCEHYGTILL
jgi:hypothetical protein